MAEGNYNRKILRGRTQKKGTRVLLLLFGLSIEMSVTNFQEKEVPISQSRDHATFSGFQEILRYNDF